MAHPRTFYRGMIIDHPTDGPSKILSGQWWGDAGLSNHWHWEVLTTGEKKHGYGDEWKDISDRYATITLERSQWERLLQVVPGFITMIISQIERQLDA